jgi:hypothetical protein
MNAEALHLFHALFYILFCLLIPFQFKTIFLCRECLKINPLGRDAVSDGKYSHHTLNFSNLFSMKTLTRSLFFITLNGRTILHYVNPQPFFYNVAKT